MQGQPEQELSLEKQLLLKRKAEERNKFKQLSPFGKVLWRVSQVMAGVIRVNNPTASHGAFKGDMERCHQTPPRFIPLAS